MNELVIPEPKTNIELGTIILENQKILEEMVDAFIQRYQGTVVTADTVKESKRSRAELNKLSKALTEKKRSDKKEFLKPLKSYESKIKAIIEKVDKCSNDINVQIKDFEQQERKSKEEQVINLIEEMAKNYDVSPNEVEIDPKWLNKSASKKSIVDGIANIMKQRKTINDNKTIIEKYASEHGMDPIYYVDLAEEHSLLDIEKKIDDDLILKQKREEAKKAAEKAKVEAEKEKSERIGNTLVNRNTGETKEIKQEISITLRGSKNQLDSIAKIITELGIKVVTASKRKEVIE